MNLLPGMRGSASQNIKPRLQRGPCYLKYEPIDDCIEGVAVIEENDVHHNKPRREEGQFSLMTPTSGHSLCVEY